MPKIYVYVKNSVTDTTKLERRKMAQKYKKMPFNNVDVLFRYKNALLPAPF
jgi:hypothetical protein